MHMYNIYLCFLKGCYPFFKRVYLQPIEFRLRVPAGIREKAMNTSFVGPPDLEDNFHPLMSMKFLTVHIAVSFQWKHPKTVPIS